MIFQTRQQLEVHSRENARNMYCGNGVSVCQILADMKLFVLSQDVTMTPHLAFDGVWEPWVTTFVQNRVRRDMNVINVGAAYGYYAQICGQIGANVVAYEAQARLAELIRWSTQANGFHKNVGVIRALVSGQSGANVPFYTESHRVGGGTTHAHGGSLFDENQVVHTIALDDEKYQRVDFMIVDVEGHEPEVIQGATKLLEASPHLELVMEVTPCWYRENPKQAKMFWDYLESRFDMFFINNDGGTTRTSVEEVQREAQATLLFAEHGWQP